MTRVAVLDSDAGTVETLTRRLAPAFSVTGTTHADDALDLIERGGADVLVTDILSSLDGLELVIAARKRKPKLPIVVVSASTEPGDPQVRHIVYRYTVPGSHWNGEEPDRAQLIRLLGEGG